MDVLPMTVAVVDSAGERQAPVPDDSMSAMADSLPTLPLRNAPPLDSTLVGTQSPERPSRLRVVKWLYQDAGGLGRRVATPEFALYTAGALAFTFGLAWLDDDARDFMHDANTGIVRDYFMIVDTLGGPVINIPVIAAAGISLLTNDQRFQDAAWTSLQTLIYAGALGYMFKTIFGRERPIWTDDPYRFFERSGRNPFPHEGNSSFPSGHAISSFGIITPWVLYYPNVFTYALYLIPAGTSLSRVAQDNHWATDIVVGTVIGITMGRWLVARHKRQQTGTEPPRVEISVVPGGNGLRLTYRLD